MHIRECVRDPGAAALGEGEIVLHQGVLRAHPASDHAVAAQGAAGARRTRAVEERIRYPLPRAPEVDAHGRAAR